MKSTLAPIVFFAYNRPDHTRQVLESLSRNKLASESSLFIYIDGPKPDATAETRAAIEAVKKVAAEKQWCKEVHITAAEANKGLIKSNVEGVTKMVNQFGKVIAMEDDGILSPGFLQYMNDALNFYEDNPQVMHVAAFSRPDLKAYDIDEPTYFFYHTTTWGWATWKRAWDKFKLDPMAVREAAKKKGNIKRLNMDNTFEFYWGLKAVAQGKLRSWNAIWHSTVFLNDGLCLYPKKSLVSNIGHDGSGTNCEPDDRFKIDDNALAAEIPVTKIPLQNNEVIRKRYIALHSFKYRFVFIAKHYLRYIFK
ncbi:glycosyltransferase family protein [Ferruginibacter sp.]